MLRKYLRPILILSLLIFIEPVSAGCGEGQLTPVKPLIASLPDDLKPLMKAALLDAFTFTSASWTPIILTNMKVSGLFTTDELRAIVESRLEEHMKYGRAAGLSSVTIPMMLSGPARLLKQDVVLQNARFTEKYDLSKFVPLVDAAHVFDDKSTDSSHPYMLQAAIRVQLPKLQQEILQHMLLLRDYHGATIAAERASADQALLYIALFAITDYFRPSSKNYLSTNAIWDAIEALKRVQKAQFKPMANQILIDLADEFLSKSLLTEILVNNGIDVSDESIQELKKQHYELTFKALRSTGELRFKIYEDSIKVNFVTEVTNSEVKKRIQTLLKEAKGAHLSLVDNEAKYASVAIGDTVQIQKWARGFLLAAIEKEDDFQISSTLKEFALIHDRENFIFNLKSFLDLLLKRPPYFHNVFQLTLYGLKKSNMTHAFQWMEDAFKNELQDPKYQNHSELIRIYLKYDSLDPNDMAYRDEQLKYLPPREGLDPDVYMQFGEETHTRVYARKNRSRLTRDEMKAQAQLQIDASNGLNARSTILRAALELEIRALAKPD